ncbi:acyl carrier protein [Lacrimispora sp. 210928-DFI.3.58]|uniref:acyl carrier protein n=1 Tax=Lacrimispora sp. 210928-DFI.3.58 TaxID=2883214 RepID=UPI0015B3BCC3|nr:acyl carrier protein [Lacrimispora sp. 210928-DFI.3.58]MCB7319419.1 acyl carrier protein [Lacrimispora sp. 210928-DFI.3.58]
MDRRQIEEKIMEEIKGISEGEEYSLDMDLMDEIGFSSIEMMELISYAEKEFDVKIASRELRLVATPADLTRLIEEKKQV